MFTVQAFTVTLDAHSRERVHDACTQTLFHTQLTTSTLLLSHVPTRDYLSEALSFRPRLEKAGLTQGRNGDVANVDAAASEFGVARTPL